MVCKIEKFSGVTFLAFIVASVIFSGCASTRKTVSNVPVKTDQTVAEPKMITAIIADEDESAAVIKIAGNQALDFSALKPFPANVTLYFPDTGLELSEPVYPSDSGIIASIKVFELTEKGDGAKVVISLKKDIFYEARNTGTDVEVILVKKSAGDGDIAEAAVKVEKKPEPVVLKENEKKGGAENITSASLVPAWIQKIDFLSEKTGESTLIIGTTAPVKYKIVRDSGKRLYLTLFNTKMHSYRERPLITTRFQSAVDRIIPANSVILKGTVLISIELREAVPFFVDESENLLYIHFGKSSIPPKPMADASLPPWQKILEETRAEDGVPGEKGGADADGRLPDLLSGSDKIYTGEKIALDFYETNIKNVFKIMQNISGKNFAIDDDVAGRVTLSFEDPVPWDQALDLVLKMNQLGRTFEGNIVRISTVKTLLADQQARQKQLKAKQDSILQEDLVTEFITVNYAIAEDIKALIDSGKRYTVLTRRGSISVDVPSNTIIITDVPEAIKQSKKIVEKMDSVVPLVIIEARIVEVTKEFIRNFGVNWNVKGGPLDHKQLGNLGGYQGPYIRPDIDPDKTSPGLLYGAAMNKDGDTTIGINFARLTGTSFLLDATLSALEVDGKAKIVSSPRVVTANNKKATIKQGQEVPYLERDDSGGATVKFKQVDLLLEVTPHITADGRIGMAVKITKNDVLEDKGDGEPAISTKEIDTNLLVDNGGTVVIGGIVQESKRTSMDGTPWLSKIPVLGWLFKINKNSTVNAELLIFITPKIVQI